MMAHVRIVFPRLLHLLVCFQCVFLSIYQQRTALFAFAFPTLHNNIRPTTIRTHYNSPSISNNRTFTHTSLSLYWGSDDEEPLRGGDRLKACIPYLLPFLDMDTFSHYLCLRFSFLSTLHDVLIEPLVQYMIQLPWLSILLFLTFTLGTRSATHLPRTVRFNAQQAALLDVGLVIPMAFAQVFSQENQIPYSLKEVSCNTVYFTFLFLLGYCIWSNGNGKKPNQIPWISETAELMTGPY